MKTAKQAAISVLATAALAVEGGSPLVNDLSDHLAEFFNDLPERPKATSAAALLASAALSAISASDQEHIKDEFKMDAIRAAASTFMCAIACIDLKRSDIEKIAAVLIEIGKIMDERSSPGGKTSQTNPMNN